MIQLFAMTRKDDPKNSLVYLVKLPCLHISLAPSEDGLTSIHDTHLAFHKYSNYFRAPLL